MSKKAKKVGVVTFPDAMADDDEIIRLEAERRKQRIEQNEITMSIESRRDEMEDVSSSLWDDTRIKTNVAHNAIFHTREALRDSTIMKSLTESMLKKATKLDDSSKSFNYKNFVLALKRSYGSDGGDEDLEEEELDEVHENDPVQGDHRHRRTKKRNNMVEMSKGFNWRKFGADCGQLFMTCRPMSTMYGPLGVLPKVRKAIVRKVREKDFAQTEVPEEVNQDNADKDGKEFNEATFARIHKQQEVIEAMSKIKAQNNPGEQAPHLPLLNILVDLEDNIQTIENFFDFAFLIKENTVVQAKPKNGLPICLNPNKVMIERQMKETNSQQMVLAINIEELNQLIDLCPHGNFGYEEDEEESNTNGQLHRKEDIYSLKDVHAQAILLAKEEADAAMKKATANSQKNDSLSSQKPPKKSRKKSTSSSPGSEE